MNASPSTEAAAARGPWVLALDAGSSSTRALLFDRRGVPADVPVTRVDYRWRTTPPGAMEVDAEVLVDAAFRVLDEATAAARALGIRITAIASATFWHGLMGVDADGSALTPLTGWGDTRARPDAAELRARMDEDDVHRRTGCFVHESYPAVRLLWLRRTAGDTFPRVAGWLSIGEHLGERLFGVRRVSASIASGTGLLDLRACRWDAEMLAAAGIDAARLPELSDEPLRGMRAEHAARWPELADVPWFPSLGDGACATLGSGAVRAGQVALTVGTSAAVRVLRQDSPPRVPDALWCYRLDARRTVAGRALSNGGNGFDWLKRTLRLPPDAELESLLAAEEAGPAHLSVVPELVGERPPLSDAGEEAMIAGMTPDTTPAQIARAWLQAVAERIAQAVRALEREFGRTELVVASGGALHASPAWTRMIERAVDRPLRLRPDAEETARGAALAALERLGIAPDPADERE